jgi:putative endonuclease
MPHQRQKFGASGEEVAADFLSKQGMTILDRNYHFGRYAEIDLIGRDQAEIVFIEVKTRSGVGFGNPEDAVTLDKQTKIRQAAESYLLQHPQLAGQYRFDVVAITYLNNQPQIEHFKNVF